MLKVIRDRLARFLQPPLGRLVAVGVVLVLAVLVGAIVFNALIWAEALVAIGTLTLAGVTVWLILDGKAARQEQEIIRQEQELSRQALVFRAAMVEQVENCRRCRPKYPYSVDLSFTQLRWLVEWSPSFTELTTLLGSVSVPADVCAYLMWLVAQVTDRCIGC